MQLTAQTKPISYLKANAVEVLNTLAESQRPLIVTQNGEAKAVLQDIASFEETQETLALLKLLAIGNQEVEAGRTKPFAEAIKTIKARENVF